MNHPFLHKLQQAIERKLPFVLYRLPGETQIQLNVQDNSGQNKILFHSFDSRFEKAISDANPLEIAPSEFEFDCDLDLKYSEKSNTVSRENYIQLIQKAIHKIQNSGIQKIVMSRNKIVENQQVDLFQTFRNLVDHHPGALVYFWHNPREETWMGATPELLLHQSENQIQTVSLAGTKLPENQWTEKEIAEQQFVTDFISDEFYELENLKINGPETIQAGKFQHLKSYISAEAPADFNLEKLLKNIHPTPAVCGLPKKEAFDFILENEGYDREFYAGYIGIDSPRQTKTYFVNLRCAQFFQNQIDIYVGGGITAESNPEKEWEETELKSGTIGNAVVF